MTNNEIQAYREELRIYHAKRNEQPILTCVSCGCSEKNFIMPQGEGWTKIEGKTHCACCAGEKLNQCELCGKLGEHTHDRVPQEWHF